MAGNRDTHDHQTEAAAEAPADAGAGPALGRRGLHGGTAGG